MNDGIESTLRELQAQQEIRDCIMRYCRGVDRCDEELIRSVFHPDATDDHGYWKGSGWDFATFIVEKLSEHEWTTHAVHNVLAEVEGHVAFAETYMEAAIKPRDVDELRVFVGRHVDRFERRDGAWKVADKLVVHDRDDVRPLQQGRIGLPLQGFSRGRRDREDPAYRR